MYTKSVLDRPPMPSGSSSLAIHTDVSRPSTSGGPGAPMSGAGDAVSPEVMLDQVRAALPFEQQWR
jgi:hypothetical protein